MSGVCHTVNFRLIWQKNTSKRTNCITTVANDAEPNPADFRHQRWRWLRLPVYRLSY